MMRWVLLAATAIAFIFTGSPADAGFVAPVIAAIGAFKATAIGAFIFNIGITIAGSLLTQLFAPDVKKPTVKERGLQIPNTTAGENESQTIILGQRATGGHIVYRNSSGDDGKTPNAFLYEVIEICDLPGGSLDGVIINDTLDDLSGPVNVDGYTELTQFNEGSKVNAWLRYYDGSQPSADPELVARFGGLTEYEWTALHKGTGVAYVVLIYRFNRKVFQGRPRAKFIYGGIPLYDPRKDSTVVGGSGAHRYNDPSTWEPSNNTAVQVYNVLRGIPMPTGEIYGARVEADDVPLANAVAGMNVCDTVVDGRPQFETSIEVAIAEDQPKDVIQSLLAGTTGQIAEVGGLWFTRFGPPAAPSMAFTQDDVSISDPRTFDPIKGLESTRNAVVSTYIDPQTLWQPRTTDILRNPEWEAEDDGQLLTANLEMQSVFNGNQARQVQAALIADDRRHREISAVFPPDAIGLTALDDITFTDPRWGIDAKDFEVQTTVFRTRSGMMELAMRERDPADFAFKSDLEEPLRPAFVQIPAQVAQQVEGFDANPLTITDADGARRGGINLSWNTTGIDDVEILRWQIRRTGTTEPVREGIASIEDGKVDVVEGLLPTVGYEARAEYIADRPVTWTAWEAVTTPGVFIGTVDLEEGAVTEQSSVTSATTITLTGNETDNSLSIVFTTSAGNITRYLATLQIATSDPIASKIQLLSSEVSGDDLLEYDQTFPSGGGDQAVTLTGETDVHATDQTVTYTLEIRQTALAGDTGSYFNIVLQLLEFKR